MKYFSINFISAEMDLTDLNAMELFGDADDISSDEEDKDARPGPQGSGDEDTVRRVSLSFPLHLLLVSAVEVLD